MLSTTHIFKQDFAQYMDEELEKYKEDALRANIKEVEIVQDLQFFSWACYC